MQKQSAGLLMYRQHSAVEFFLVHPGGPFWAHRDMGVWTIPKGQFVWPEEPMDAAQREFREETGFTSEGPFFPLGAITQAGGKLVHAWAFQGECDPAALVSNTCQMEWPPRSRRMITVPEVDRGGWFSTEQARRKILASQSPFLDRLIEILGETGP